MRRMMMMLMMILMMFMMDTKHDKVTVNDVVNDYEDRQFLLFATVSSAWGTPFVPPIMMTMLTLMMGETVSSVGPLDPHFLNICAILPMNNVSTHRFCFHPLVQCPQRCKKVRSLHPLGIGHRARGGTCVHRYYP